MSTGDLDPWTPEDDARGQQMLSYVEEGVRLREIILASRELWSGATTSTARPAWATAPTEAFPVLTRAQIWRGGGVR